MRKSLKAFRVVKMERVVYKNLVPSHYLIQLGYEGGMKAAEIYILNEGIRRQLRESLVYTYDGLYWTRASGGSGWKRGRHYMKFLTENLFNIIGIKPEDREKFKEFFFGGDER